MITRISNEADIEKEIIRDERIGNDTNVTLRFSSKLTGRVAVTWTEPCETEPLPRSHPARSTVYACDVPINDMLRQWDGGWPVMVPALPPPVFLVVASVLARYQSFSEIDRFLKNKE